VIDGILQSVVQPTITGIFAVISALILTRSARVNTSELQVHGKPLDAEQERVPIHESSSRNTKRRDALLLTLGFIAAILAVLALVLAFIAVGGWLGSNKALGGIVSAVAAAGALVSGIAMNRMRPGANAMGREGATERKLSLMKTRIFVWVIAPIAGVSLGLGLLAAGVNPAQTVMGQGPVPLKPPFAISGYFYASGFEGEDIAHIGEHIKLNSQWTTNCYPDPTCMKFQYIPGDSSWAGVYWQSPTNNWGDQPGRRIVGAKKLIFWARGEAGGELVSFKVGGIQGKKYQDSLEVAMDPSPVKLTTQWQHYNIDLTGTDTSCVIGVFSWSIATDGNPHGAIFYLDGIRVE
jgi:hypothetical protein